MGTRKMRVIWVSGGEDKEEFNLLAFSQDQDYQLEFEQFE